MDTDNILYKYYESGRDRREHMWFAYPGLRREFDSVEMGYKPDMPEGSDCRELLADRTKKMSASKIREILKVVSQPGMVSLAGGVPAPESFPMDIMKELTTKVMDKYSSTAFQYDLTEGFFPLREALSSYLNNRGIQANAEEILIASGSQGVLDTLGKIIISEGDKIIIEEPTYLGALQAFSSYGPEYIHVQSDEEGPIPGFLEDLFHSNKVKFIYLVPTFQNPTGRSISLTRRKEIAEILKKHDALLVEDDPYGDLRYRGESIPAFKSIAPENVVYISSLSKIFAPGLRVGFCVAPDLIRHWMVLAKQGIDLHTSTLNQALAAEYISGGYLEEHLPKIIRLYRPRQEAMLNAIERYFPDSFKWSRPEGGMFIWVEGPEGLDMEKIYWRAIERRTAFVPGKFFYTKNGEGEETMRLNFTMADEEKIDWAIKALSFAIREYL